MSGPNRTESRKPESFTLSWEIPHPPAKVWRALTETDLLSEWIMPNDMKLEVGHKFTFKQFNQTTNKLLQGQKQVGIAISQPLPIF